MSCAIQVSLPFPAYCCVFTPTHPHTHTHTQRETYTKYTYNGRTFLCDALTHPSIVLCIHIHIYEDPTQPKLKYSYIAQVKHLHIHCIAPSGPRRITNGCQTQSHQTHSLRQTHSSARP